MTSQNSINSTRCDLNLMTYATLAVFMYAIWLICWHHFEAPPPPIDAAEERNAKHALDNQDLQATTVVNFAVHVVVPWQKTTFTGTGVTVNRTEQYYRLFCSGKSQCSWLHFRLQPSSSTSRWWWVRRFFVSAPQVKCSWWKRWLQ